MNVKRIVTYSLAVVTGAAALGLVFVPSAKADACSTMCYMGHLVMNVPAMLQAQYLSKGGECVPANTPPSACAKVSSK